jgi:dTMP kinase
MKKGRFITFEGGEGCGKSTQIRRLEAYLKEKGVEVLVTREPGGTRLAELIRGLLKDEKDDPPCDRAELLLFLAARAQLVKNVILPALDSGVWVLSDRFSDSTFAYQGYGRGLDLGILKVANDFACDSLKPDLTLLLDVPPEVASSRMRKRERETNTSADRIELAGEEFHRKLREGFRALAAAESDRVHTIDASGAPDQVWEAVCRSLKRLI